nr:uncharacterized mitochondrial protein AtMg00810-like [Tanacetum cinerariifolium]
PQVVSDAKLPILKPNEFDLWKMRIEQYFLMIDYTLWEVIFNGDSPAPTRVIEGVVQPVALTTAEQRLARKNELKARDINLKFLRSLPTEWRTRTLIWRNKTDLEEQSLDDLFNSLKIYEAKVKSSSTASTSTQNIAFVSSNTDYTTEPVECYNCHKKWHFIRECRSHKDTRKNFAAEPQRRNVLVETSTSNALVSQCNGVGSYDWSFQAEAKPTNYALMAFSSLSSSCSDNEVASCSKSCTKAYATLQSHYDKLTNKLRKSQFDVLSYQTRLESVEARLLVYQQNETIFEENIKLLKLDIELRDKALVVLRQKFENAEQERDDLKLKLEKFQTFSKNLSNLLASQTNDKIGLGYNTQVFTSFMLDSDELFDSKSDESLHVSPINDRYQSGDGYHVVPPPYTGTFMPPKPDLVFNNALNVNETVHTAFNVKLSPTKPDTDLSHTNRPSAPIIDDWVSDSKDDFEAEIPHNTPSFVQPIEQVKPPRPSVKNVETSIPAVNLKTVNPKPKSQGNSKNKKACFGNPHHALNDKGVINNGWSRHMTGNMSYLSDFEEIHGGYVAFGGNPKGDTECIVLSPEFKLPDENQVLLRVPRENNMYNVALKNIFPSGDLTCLFAKATLDESNLWHRRLGYINFKTMNKLVKGKFDKKVDEGFLVGYSISSKAFRNTDGDVAFEVKEPEFEGRKPEFEVHVSPSSSAHTKKHDDKTKRVAKGKSLVESLIGYRNLSAEFEDFSDNSINEVNAAGTSVPAIGQIFTDSTNTFSDVGHSNTDVSPTHRKYSYIDTSQLPNDPNMPELEDITYSDDEEDVGAEPDFTNLETTITVSPIPTTRVHKDHPVTQIIVAMIEAIRLFLAYASFMGFMVYQMDVKSAFLYGTIEEEALYELHQAPRAWYETLANYLLENGFQRGKIDHTLFIKRQQASTPIDTDKPLLKDPDGEDVDVHTYRSMIDSLMYLTSSRPDIMFVVCACARFQVTLKVSHLHAIKRIFRYLKGKPHLGLWYPKDSPFNLVAYLDSDYARASLDRKSTTGGCQFLRCRLISWQCKKQTVIATSSTEAEYVTVASCCAQVLWI